MDLTWSEKPGGNGPKESTSQTHGGSCASFHFVLRSGSAWKGHPWPCIPFLHSLQLKKKKSVSGLNSPVVHGRSIHSRNPCPPPPFFPSPNPQPPAQTGGWQTKEHKRQHLLPSLLCQRWTSFFCLPALQAASRAACGERQGQGWMWRPSWQSAWGKQQSPQQERQWRSPGRGDRCGTSEKESPSRESVTQGREAPSCIHPSFHTPTQCSLSARHPSCPHGAHV